MYLSEQVYTLINPIVPTGPVFKILIFTVFSDRLLMFQIGYSPSYRRILYKNTFSSVILSLLDLFHTVSIIIYSSDIHRKKSS